MHREPHIRNTTAVQDPVMFVHSFFAKFLFTEYNSFIEGSFKDAPLTNTVRYSLEF